MRWPGRHTPLLQIKSNRKRGAWELGRRFPLSNKHVKLCGKGTLSQIWGVVVQGWSRGSARMDGVGPGTGKR